VSKTGVTASMTLGAGAGNISMLLNGADGDNFWYNGGQNIANQTIAQFDFPAATLLNRIEITTDGNGSFLNAGATVKVQGWDGTTWVDVSVTFTTADPSTSTLSQYSSVKFDFFSNATAYTKYRVFGVSGTTRSNPDVYEAYFIVNQILAGNDLDNDGIPNQFDLDSDGDGCSDAIEGGTIFTTANLVSSSIPGGNSGGGYTGSSSSPVTQNLGNTVGNTTTTLGVPTIAGTGQTKAASQDGAVNGCTDSDGDAVADYDDLDDDNDGIQDIVECPSPPGNRRILVYNVGVRVQSVLSCVKYPFHQ
jgi:hypothetical protein